MSVCMLQGVHGNLEVSTSPDDDNIDELLLLSDVDASLRSLSLKHHLAIKSVCSVYVRKSLTNGKQEI